MQNHRPVQYVRHLTYKSMRPKIRACNRAEDLRVAPAYAASGPKVRHSLKNVWMLNDADDFAFGQAPAARAENRHRPFRRRRKSHIHLQGEVLHALLASGVNPKLSHSMMIKRPSRKCRRRIKILSHVQGEVLSAPFAAVKNAHLSRSKLTVECNSCHPPIRASACAISLRFPRRLICSLPQQRKLNRLRRICNQ